MWKSVAGMVVVELLHLSKQLDASCFLEAKTYVLHQANVFNSCNYGFMSIFDVWALMFSDGQGKISSWNVLAF